MKKILVLISVIAFSSASLADDGFEKQSYKSYGAGSAKCDQVLKDYNEGDGKILYNGWMSGYITALNSYISGDISEGYGLDGAVAYVKVYCEINPQQHLADAMSDFIVLMAKKQNESRNIKN